MKESHVHTEGMACQVEETAKAKCRGRNILGTFEEPEGSRPLYGMSKRVIRNRVGRQEGGGGGVKKVKGLRCINCQL